MLMPLCLYWLMLLPIMYYGHNAHLYCNIMFVEDVITTLCKADVIAIVADGIATCTRADVISLYMTGGTANCNMWQMV